MPSKTGHQEIGQSDFFNIEVVFICSFLDSLFNQFSTKFWTTFGYLFGFLSGAFSGIWNTLGMPLDTKTLKNCEFFKVFEIKLFGSLKLLMALLGSSCPLSGRSGPKMDPKMIPKTAQKKILRLSTFFVWFFQKYNSIKIRRITVQFCNTIWTNLFAQNP